MKTIIAQIIGIFAMIATVSSFQKRTRNGIILFQNIGSVMWMVHFFMMGAYTGCILNGIAIAKNLVILSRRGKTLHRKLLLVAVIAVCIAVYILDFTFLSSYTKYEFNLLTAVKEILPILAMSVATVAFCIDDAGTVRKLNLFISPLWLVYDAWSASIGGTITEICSLISIGVGMYRLDRKKKETTSTTP